MKKRIQQLSYSLNNFATPGRIYVYPRIMAAIAAVMLLGNYLLGEGYYDFAGNLVGADFLSFYSNAIIFWSGEYSSFYSLEHQFKVMADVIPNFSGGIAPFLNPPYASILYAPFGTLDYLQALILWWVLGLMALFSSLFLLNKHLTFQQDIRQRNFIYLLPIFFLPTWQWFAYAQVSTFILLILTLSFVLLRQNKEFQAGLVLGLLAFKPQLALPLALPILIKLRWKAIAGGAITVSLWCLVGFYLFPEQMFQYWQERDSILAVISMEGYPIWGIHSYYGFFQLILEGTLLTYTVVLISIGTVVYLFNQWYKTSWQPGTPEWDLRMSATMVAGLCLAIQLFSYDLLLLLLPFIVSYRVYQSAFKSTKFDNDILFSATILVYIVTFFSANLTLAQLNISQSLINAQFAIQLSTLSLIFWVLAAFRASRKINQPSHV